MPYKLTCFCVRGIAGFAIISDPSGNKRFRNIYLFSQYTSAAFEIQILTNAATKSDASLRLGHFVNSFPAPTLSLLSTGWANADNAT